MKVGRGEANPGEGSLVCAPRKNEKKVALDPKSGILDRGRRLEPTRRARESEGWVGRAESSTGVARFSPSKESGHIAKSRRSPFFEDLPRGIAIQGHNNKTPGLSRNRFVREWCTF